MYMKWLAWSVTYVIDEYRSGVEMELVRSNGGFCMLELNQGQAHIVDS